MSDTMFTRSTKGASKQRRELINVEISTIRDLLPLQEGVRKRLSQLQVMAICKAFIGKNNFFDRMPELFSSSSDSNDSSFDFSQTLPGFLVMATLDGKFLYLSDNVMEILGHSMVDIITQSETIFDLFDDRGQSKVMELVSDESSIPPASSVADETVTFTCLMGLTKNVRRHPGLDRQKVVTVTACLFKPLNHCLDVGEPVLVAFCSPSSAVIPSAEPVPIFNTMVFQTRHSVDMKLRSIDSNGEFHLGYSAKELHSRSWYEFIHPDQESEFAAVHLELISSGSDFVSSIFFQVQTRYGHFIWLHVMMRLMHSNDHSNGQSEILCVCQVLDEEQAAFKREREQLEVEFGNYVNSTQGFDSNLCLYASNDVPNYGTVSYQAPAPAVWNETVPGRRQKRKPGDDSVYYGKPRKMTRSPLPSVDDSVSSATASTVSFTSPVRLEVDQAFQFGPMEAFPGSRYSTLLQSDFNPSADESLHVNASSPYSTLSDSLCGRSPRMYPEDDGSFFLSLPNVAEQKSIGNEVLDTLVLEDLKPLGHLGDMKTFNLDTAGLTSPMQEAPNELPELDLTYVYDYLKTVEDDKEFIQNFGQPDYIGGPSTSSNNWKLADAAGATFDYQRTHASGLNFEKHLPESAPRTRGTAAFSGSAFLERLIESPQFAELIGMMANGAAQRRSGLQDQGPQQCFG